MCSCGQAKTVQRDIVGVVNNFATDNMECAHPEIDTDCDNVRIGHGLRSCRCRGPYVVLLLLMHSVSIELPATLVLLGLDLGSTRHRRYWRLGAARLDLVAHATWLCIMCR
jgi:hypothetical protein